MRTSSRNDFLNGNQIGVLRAVAGRPEGVSTNALFDDVRDGMAKHTFVKTLNELERFDIIERTSSKNRRMIRYSPFLKAREDIVNRERAGFAGTLDAVVGRSKGMAKDKRKKFLFRELARFSLIVSEVMGTNMVANSSYFRNDKCLAWANMQSFDMMRTLSKDVEKAVNAELGRSALREFSEYQSGQFQKYISTRVGCLAKMRKRGNKKLA
jgi:hypothetical protein